eukprot:2635515-Pleurochrysis_carterae.AAC.1
MVGCCPMRVTLSVAIVRTRTQSVPRPALLFALILHAFSRVSVVPRKHAPNETTHAALASASAVPPASPPSSPQARVRNAVPGPHSSARALLAGRPRR